MTIFVGWVFDKLIQLMRFNKTVETHSRVVIGTIKMLVEVSYNYKVAWVCGNNFKVGELTGEGGRSQFIFDRGRGWSIFTRQEWAFPVVILVSRSSKDG